MMEAYTVLTELQDLIKDTSGSTRTLARVAEGRRRDRSRPFHPSPV